MSINKADESIVRGKTPVKIYEMDFATGTGLTNVDRVGTTSLDIILMFQIVNR